MAPRRNTTNWNDVTNKLVEIESLQQLLTIKISDSKNKEIIVRYNKYHDITKDSINKLNNAVLENRIRKTPFQFILLSVVMNEKIPLTMEEIYDSMSDNLETTISYLNNLQKKYEDMIKIFDIVFKIEELSQTELTTVPDYENGVYIKVLNKYNAAFLEFLQQDVKESASLIKNTTKELIENLSKNERSKLLQETIPLSYDRNAFTYIDEIKTVKSIYKNPTVPLKDELYIYKLLLYFKEAVYISLEEYFSKQDISKLISFFEEVLSIKEDKIKKV